MSLLKNAHALIIGTEYDDDLNTIGDAEDIASILTDPTLSGYPPKNVTLLTGNKADRKGILKAFDNLIKKTDENSSVFLYYSGHGGVYTYEETGERVFYFCPYGFGMEPQITIEEAEKVWLKADEVKLKINALKSKRLIFFLDCCHSTGMTFSGFTPSRNKASKTKKGKTKSRTEKFTKASGLAQKIDNERGISIVASCKEDQESYQIDDRNSVFTSFLLNALKGKHRTDFKDPYIRIMEVSSYLFSAIPPYVQEAAAACDPPMKIAQEPYVNFELYDNFILSQVPLTLRQKKVLPDPEMATLERAKGPKEMKTIYRESPGANNLLLFIHGFSGEAGDTFGKTPEFLMSEASMDGWDMKPFGYSQFVTPEMGKDIWAGIADIDRISEYLCTSVKYKFDKYDRIAIVAHSLGGLIAQRAILDFKEEYRSKISHIILFGTPSNGIEPEKLTKLWNAKYREMSSQGDFITTLRKDWHDNFPKAFLFTKLKVVAATDDEFLTPNSCIDSFPKEDHVMVSGKHLSMVKPKDKNDACYQLILNTLTESKSFENYTNKEEINIALGKYDAVVKKLMPMMAQLDENGLKQLIFALEGLDRREEALQILETHPKANEATDLMGIIGGRYKRAYLRFPTVKDGETAYVYYSIALEKSQANNNQEQIYYHAINLAFLSLVIEQDKDGMKNYAQLALDAAETSSDDLWKIATVAEAHMYLGYLEKARVYYGRAAAMAGIREKISIHLNAYAGYTSLMKTDNPKDGFILFLKEHFLA
ncbi:MAG: caspase family protein [Flavobacteriaceae bacterium]